MIPADLDYAAIEQISNESKGKLAAVRPLTLGQASRISGVTPADISVLMVHLAERKRAAGKAVSEMRPDPACSAGCSESSPEDLTNTGAQDVNVFIGHFRRVDEEPSGVAVIDSEVDSRIVLHKDCLHRL